MEYTHACMCACTHTPGYFYMHRKFLEDSTLICYQRLLFCCTFTCMASIVYHRQGSTFYIKCFKKNLDHGIGYMNLYT